MTMIETRGRKVKFTPDALEQVKQWVDEGIGRVEIAQRLNTSIGSLQVTCSHKGIRLRRPKRQEQVSMPINNSRLSELPSLATYRIMINDKEVTLSLSRDIETELALDAVMHDVGICDWLGQLLTTALQQKYGKS